ncbi:odorant receptor 131-2-like [Lethenteron reissneri]|uniref:odorant receptor 131-2-like n=1 Tax=Lethenteron reissneri TaxID=7753 RepID=UPI002AB693E0|nr:odorant receptor 131-2-like [Lethenteron reissneri]
MITSNTTLGVNISYDSQLLLLPETMADIFSDILVIITMVPSTLFAFLMTFTFLCEIKLKENSKYIFFINLVISDSMFLFIVDVSSILFICGTRFNVGGCSFYINFYRGLFNNGVTCISLMAIERFVAICHPLRYHNIFNQKSALRCLGMIWFISFFFPVVEIIFMVTTDNLAFQRVAGACEDVNYIFVKDYVLLEYIRNCVFVLFFSVSFVILVSTYILVVKAAKQAASRESEASKAKHTLRLHAVQLILYMSAFLIQPFKTLIDLTVNDSDMNYMLKTFLYYFMFVSPRFFSPFIYGLRDKEIRRYLRRRVCCGQNVLKVNPEHTIFHKHA